MSAVRWHIPKHVDPDREVEVSGVEIHQVVGTIRRDVSEDLLGEIAVRVDESDAVAKVNVLKKQIPQQRRFARAGLPDDVDMLALVSRGNAKRQRIPPSVALPDDNVWFVVHGSKTSRHSYRLCVPRAFGLTPAASRQGFLRANADKCVWGKPAR